MTAATRRRSTTAARPANGNDRGTPGRCDSCSAALRIVTLADGSTARIDTDQDGEGDIHAARIAGSWVWRDAKQASGPGLRYRRHRCAPTNTRPVRDLRKATSDDSTEGPCAARCGAYVPHRYGPTPQMMCDPCTARLAAWRAAGGRERFPTGRHGGVDALDPKE